jgi:acid phosphatase
MPRPIFFPAVTGLAGLLAGYFLGVAGSTSANQAPPKAEPAAVTMDMRVASNLWLQTSAEYCACCLQTYRLAGERLEQYLVATRPVRPAVVMDLDETVFDNSAFQTALYATGKEYEPALWDDYEKNYPTEVRAVPGALEFIQRAEKLGVTVVYISNRNEEFRTQDIAAIKHLGLSTEGIEGRLFLKPKGKDVSSNKAARREAVAARYNVLLMFGDNLRDFSDSFAPPKVDPASGLDGLKAAIAERNKLADAAAVHWGVDWFVLPNPVYGEWDRMCGKDPKAVFPPTKIAFGKSPSVPVER